MSSEISDKGLSSLILSKKFLVIFFVLMFTVALNALFLYQDRDMELVITIPLVFTAIIGCFLILKNSDKFRLLPYFLMQTIIFWIFADSKIQDVTGISFKLYGIFFALSSIIAFIRLFKYFNHLWQNSVFFRLIFIFFCINIFYFLFYHSDFREWATDYFNTWYFADINFRRYNASGSSLFGGETGQFSETQMFGMYLGSLCPLISATLALTIFKIDDTKEKIHIKLEKIIKYFSFSLIIYYILSLITVITGISQYIFIEEGRLWGNFLGISGFADYYMCIFIILLVGFKYYLHRNKCSFVTECFINAGIIISSGLLIMYMVKTSIIALALALAAMYLLSLKCGFRPKILNIKNRILSIIIAATATLTLLIIGYNYIDTVISSIEGVITRFSTYGTFSNRFNLWYLYINQWLSNLDLFKIIFGFGLDASRELALRAASMLPGF